MAYNISASQDPQFSPVIDSASIGNWDFNQPLNIIRYFFPGQALPSPVSIDFTVPDVITQYQDSNEFNHFLVKWNWDYIEGPPIWRSITTDIDDGVPFTTSQEITTNLDFNVTVTFLNLDFITPGEEDDFRISGNLKLSVIGVRANGSEVVLSERTFNFKIYYILQETIATEPESLMFYHTVGDPLPAGQSLTVYHSQVAILLCNDPRFEITGAGSATQLGTSDIFSYTIPAPANGITVVTVVPKAGIEDTVGDVVSIPDAIVALITDQDNNATIDTTDISFFTGISTTTSVTPNSMSFLSIIGVQNADAQIISIISANNSTITAPSWLVLSANSVTGIGEVEVSPVSFENLSPGFYTGTITVSNNSQDYTIEVVLQVVQNIQINLSQSGFNFTDNNQAYTEVFSEDNANQLQIGVNIPQIGYPSTLEEEQTFNYLTGFLNNKSKIHIGEIVKRSLNKMTKADFLVLFDRLINTVFVPEPFHYYIPPKVRLDISTVNNVGVVQNTQETFANITFLPGRPPKVVTGFAFLSAKLVTKRIFKRSKMAVNYLADRPLKMSFYKNGNLQLDLNLPFSGLKPRCFMRSFTNYEIGDVITIKPTYLPFLSVIPQQMDIEQSFIVYQEGKHLNTIGYVNEYYTVDFFDFAGDWTIQSEYNFIESSRYKNLVEFFRNENTEKVQGITINTGFIPKDNEYFIDLLIRSGMAWLITNQTESVVELVPQTKKLTNVDSDQELYAYDVTFKINRTHDFQNYS